MYTEANIELANKKAVPLNQLLLTEASANILLHNPEALRGFEAFLTDENFSARQSLWPIASEKNQIYSENRQILLDTFEQEFAQHKDMFQWTKPGAGFFSVFTINHPNVICNSDLTDKLVAEYGVVTIPTFSFYPEDARARNSKAGLDQLRLSFCYSEGIGERRRQQLQAAASAFAKAIKQECGV